MEFNQIKELIDDVMSKRDRSVSIYISPDNGISVNVYPWPDADACSEMLKPCSKCWPQIIFFRAGLWGDEK